MRFYIAAATLALALPCLGDTPTQKLLERLAEEASAFEQTAPNLISEETLRQRALALQKRRFHPRIGAEANQPPPGPEWQKREILSEYAFASVGDPPSIREIRKVLAVDGKTVNTSDRALRDLMRTLKASDAKARKKLLEDFEKHGLVGTLTDFGQILLLFSRRNQEQYDFWGGDERLLGAERCLVFSYRQHDGPGALTIYYSKGTVQPRAIGEIWVTRDAYRLARITIKSVRVDSKSSVRDEAQVDYGMTSAGVLAPVSVTHHEFRDGGVTAENLFTYSSFRRFGASADIQFKEVPVEH